MSESRGKVLIVDDQYLVAEFLRIWVEAYGFETCATAATAASALELAMLHQPDVVLMDVRLDSDDGFEAATAILARIRTRLIYCTGSTDAATIARLETSAPHAILLKPVDHEELGRALLKA